MNFIDLLFVIRSLY